MEQLFYLPKTMIWPLAACLVLTGIHVYLGVHVIARKVIFVDLALAQIAALGTVIGVLLGYEVGKDTNVLYLYSLAFTIFGAFVFSITRMKGEKVPHEAIIGIVYAVTFASTILVLSKSALGPQELEHIIKGELLWVQPYVVLKTATIYALVGIFHYIFRKKFMAISLDVDKAEASGMNVRLWDFLFYMSFGFVITSSVAIAGVFLVFSYLVIPSVGAMLVSNKLGTRLALGWIGGSIISFIGVKLSYDTGLPTSPAIVVVLATGLLISGIFRYLRLSTSLVRAFRNLAAATAVVVIFIGAVFFFRKADENPLTHTLQMLSSPLSTDRQAAIVNLELYGNDKSQWLPLAIEKLKDQDAEVRKASVDLFAHMKEQTALPQITELLDDKSDEVRESVVNAMKVIGNSESAIKLVEKSEHEDDPEMKTSFLLTALGLGNPNAIPGVIQIIKDGGIFADDARNALQKYVHVDFSKDSPEKILQWWNDHRSRLQWDEKSEMFSLKN